VLFELFRAHVGVALEARLAADLNQIIAALEIGPDRAPRLTRRPAEPLFEKPYSGRYWQVDTQQGAMLRGRSLWDTSLALPADELPDGGLHRHHITGPAGQRLLAIERSVRLPDSPEPLRIAVAADLAELEEPLRRFGRTLALSLGALGLGLIGAVVLQVHYGLRPLRRLRAALASVRDGGRDRLAGDWPDEVQPLVRDFDAVLQHNADVLERARTQAGNLAHSLKTPISVLANAAQGAPGPLAAAVRAEVAAMQRHIDHHLARARAAAAVERPGARADAVEVAQQLARTLAKLHASRAIAVEVDGVAPPFRGDPEDLMEILGNVLDNACKWARERVRVRLGTAGGRLLITVEDDGPGLPPERRADVFVRGRRFDENLPGHGLGLSIVRDLVGLYGGAVALEASALGGLLVRLELPAHADPVVRGGAA
jgi:signal transduction histidine kinase